MIKNYLKIAFRNLSKNKIYSMINIFGLAVAFLCSTLLFLNAWFELSFDNFFDGKERIFKLYNYSIGAEGEDKGSSMSFPIAPVVKNEVPLIEASTRYMWNDGGVDYNGKKLDLQINLVDADFFNVFSFPIISGNKTNPLSDISNVVITEYAAGKIFGKEDPIGKRLKIKVTGEWKEVMVASVAKDFPKNSSIGFDMLARPELRSDFSVEKDNWNQQHHEVYVKIVQTSNAESVEEKLRYVLKTHQAIDTAYMRDQGYKLDEHGNYTSLRLLPMNEVHFNYEIGARNGSTSKTYIYTILLISFFILAIACFNFINLNIARAFTRTKEVGVRKCLGASKKQIFLQVWGESLMICIIAVALGITGAVLLFPAFNQLFAANLDRSFFYQPSTIMMLLSSIVIISLCAGGYPAMAISKLTISGVLKGSASLKKPGFFRNSLIVLQFTAACILMACTLIAYKQFEYIRNMPLGYNKENVISFPVNNSNGREVVNQFRNKLSSQTSIVSISGANVNLGLGKDGGTSKSSRGFAHKGKSVLTNWLTVDYDFLKTLGLKLNKGRDFSKEYSTDKNGGLVVTESMAKQFGEADPVGLTFSIDSAGPQYQIIGVIPDFHLYSLHEKTEPLTIDISDHSPIRYIFIKINSNNPLQVMSMIETTYKQLEPGKEFKGSFLDENTDRWYQKEKRLSILLGVSAVVAIILSCLGLFALALLMIQQRIKEIGVRKVLGASVISINNLLAKDFLKLVVVALIISTPVTWWAMNQWLQDFPYHTTISWAIFLTVGLAAVLISILTISFHTIKAALSNPVKSLRTE